MDFTTILELSATISASIGGWELIKYMLNIHTNKRKERAEADKADAEADGARFDVLARTVEFLETQLHEKEQRFAEQTDRLRDLQDKHFNLMQEKAKADLELQQYRCVRPKCLDREPQNGF